MKTRSQTKYENSALYAVDIDFDGASKAWKYNKKSTGNGCYRYLCENLNKNNKFCQTTCLSGERYCKKHFKMCKLA